MRTHALFAVGLLLVLPPVLVAAEEEVTEVTFPITLQVGDVVKLKLTRSRQQAGDDVQPIDVSHQNAVVCEVRAKNQTGFVLAWKTDWDDLATNLKALSFAKDLGGFEEHLREIVNHVLLIQTDEMATPIEILNATETAALLERLVAGMMESLLLSEDEREKTELILSQLTNSGALMSRMLQDANLYLRFTGGSFEVGADYEHESQSPSLFGGDPLPSRAVYQVVSVDAEAKEALVHIEEETDPGALRKAVESLLQSVEVGEEVLTELKGVDLIVTSRTVYTMDLISGLPKYLKFQRLVQLGPGTERVDTTEIETVSFPARE